MQKRLFFRLFLVLALACNGVLAAHAAMGAVAFAPAPASAGEPSSCHEQALPPAAPEAVDPASACCKVACQCACTAQAASLPALLAGIPPVPARGGSLPDDYPSLSAGVLLRPPIA